MAWTTPVKRRTANCRWPASPWPRTSIAARRSPTWPPRSSHAPDLPEVHELLAALAGRTPDGEGVSLYALEGEERRHVGDAGRARVPDHAGRDPGQRASSCWLPATAFDPDQGMGGHEPGYASAAPPDSAPHALVQAIRQSHEPALPTPTTDGLTPDTNAVYLRAGSAGRCGRTRSMRWSTGTAAGIARRLGHPRRRPSPLGRVRPSDREPGKLTAVWYAYALQAAGRLDEAGRR